MDKKRGIVECRILIVIQQYLFKVFSWELFKSDDFGINWSYFLLGYVFYV